MRWLLYVVGGLAMLGVLVVAIGYALPRAHVASRAATLPAPPDRVWAALVDVASYPRWRSDVAAVEILPARDGRPAWRERSRRGDAVTYAFERMAPPTRLTATITDPSLPFGGSWEYALEPDARGTRLVVTEYGDVRNPVFRFVSRFFMSPTATMDAFLSSLARQLGAAVTPVDAEPVPREVAHGA